MNSQHNITIPVCHFLSVQFYTAKLLINIIIINEKTFINNKKIGIVIACHIKYFFNCDFSVAKGYVIINSITESIKRNSIKIIIFNAILTKYKFDILILIYGENELKIIAIKNPQPKYCF